MKTIFSILFFAFALSASAQVLASKKQGAKALHIAGPVSELKTVAVGMAIHPALQKDIKDLTDAMKPYEDQWREYNRLAGLRANIYATLMKTTAYSVDSLISERLVITQDSIKMVFKK